MNLASGEFPSRKLFISVKAHTPLSLSTLLLLRVCVYKHWDGLWNVSRHARNSMALAVQMRERGLHSVLHESNCFLTYSRKNLIPRVFRRLGIELKPSKMPFESSEKITFPSAAHAPHSLFNILLLHAIIWICLPFSVGQSSNLG
jgi:hypothetical protein